MGTTPILKISDGTTTIDLLGGKGPSGFHFLSWSPSSASYKGGGIFVDSPLADSVRLVDRKWAVTTETISLRANFAEQDELIEQMGDLASLLDDAGSYFIDPANTSPVYLEVRGAGETNSRYALIITGRLTGLPTPFGQPFLQPGGSSVAQELSVIIQREHWSDTKPGTNRTHVGLSTVQEFDGRDMGTVDANRVRETTLEAIDAGYRPHGFGARGTYVANKHNTSNLTHVYFYDATAASFSANYLDDNSVPLEIPFGAPTGGGDTDIFYMGTALSASEDGPFSNVVCVLQERNSLDSSFVWEYWNGVSWTTLSVLDNTKPASTPLETSGIITFVPPSDWDTTTVNGVNGWWIRLRQTTTPTNNLTPKLAHKGGIYSVVWPYVEIAATDVTGDIDMGIDIEVRPMTDGVIGEFEGLIVAARGVSRGEDFRLHLNASDSQNPIPGVNVTALDESVFDNDIASATRRKVTFTPTQIYSTEVQPLTAPAQIVTFEFNEDLGDQYKGTYLAFLLCHASSSVTNIDWDFFLESRFFDHDGAVFHRTRRTRTATPSTSEEGYINLGQFHMPGGKCAITVRSEVRDLGSGGTSLDVFSVILIPIDEWAVQYDLGSISREGTLENSERVLISDSHQRGYKGRERAEISNFAAQATGIGSKAGGEKPRLRPGKRQRLYFVPLDHFSVEVFGSTIGQISLLSPMEMVLSVDINGQAYYLAGRGSR